MTIIEQIRDMRIKMGISQSKLASKIDNIRDTELSRIENRHVNPTAKTLEKIAKGFHKNAQWVLIVPGEVDEDIINLINEEIDDEDI